MLWDKLFQNGKNRKAPNTRYYEPVQVSCKKGDLDDTEETQEAWGLVDTLQKNNEDQEFMILLEIVSTCQ